MLNCGKYKDSISELKKKAKMKKYIVIQDRIGVIAKAKEGQTAARISYIMGYHISWVMKWIKRYREGGLENLFDLKRPGQPKKLSPEQEQQLMQFIKSSLYKRSSKGKLNIAMVAKFVHNTFGVKYSDSGIKALITRTESGVLSKKSKA